MAAQGKVWKAEIEKFEPVSHECLNTVRVLHRTVVCLRKALEKSRGELNLLKDKVHAVPSNPVYNATIEQLSLENHVLRRKILSGKRFDRGLVSMDDDAGDADDSKRTVNSTKSSLDQDTAPPADASDDRADISSSEPKSISDESEEVDDIELIFTNDDSTRIEVLEQLEPIRDDGDVSDAAASKSDLSHSLISNRSILVETDISKCGVVYREEDDAVASLNPAQFRRSAGKQMAPIIKTTARKTPLRIVTSAVRDSEAQTDISAVPPHWKSESFLADSKTSPNFPTLPSKFAIPDASASKCPPLSLTEKTQEARRTLLSDINFTSMVPELSRSVDHLCQSADDRPQKATIAAAAALAGQSGQSALAMKCLRSPALLSAGSSYSKFDFAGVTGGSSTTWMRYEQNRSTQDLSVRRKLLWRPSIYSLDAYFSSRTSSVPPSPTTRRHSAAVTCIGDAQFSDILPDKLNTKTLSNVTLKNAPCRCGRKSDVKVAFKEFSPPLSAIPFIARSPQDLKVNYFVKVINKDGRVVGGRIQYVGMIAGKTDSYVGILVPPNVGETDGTFQGFRYFSCDQNCGLYAPFRKVVMAWKV